jgi:hypothetical protein
MNHCGLKDLAIADAVMRESMAAKNAVDILFGKDSIGGIVGGVHAMYSLLRGKFVFVS